MKSITATITALATLALILTGCTATPSTANDKPTKNGTLIYATGDAEPTCLDPHVGGNYPQALVATQYLEELVSKNKAGEIIPWLATKWSEASDGLSWSFTLKSGVKFADGTPLTSAAVVANVAHLQNPKTQSSTGYLALQKVTSVTAVDDLTATINLSQPDSSLLDSLSQPWLAIESPTALLRPMATNCESPVGTGPFTVTAWNRQQNISLVRNDSYNSPPADATHKGAGFLKTIDWRFLPDSASRYAALQAGTVDVIDNVQPDTIVAAQKQKNLTAVDAPRPGASNRIELNSSIAPFDDKRVREAFIRSADVNSGITSLFFGTAKRSYSALSSIETLGFSDKSLFTYSQTDAAKLLDEAGWTTKNADGYRMKGGKVLTLDIPVSTNQSIPAELSLFEQIQATSKLAGFKVNLQPLDLSSWYGALGKNAYNLVSAPYTKVGPSVLNILFNSSGTKPAPSGYFANHSQVKDPALDALLTKAGETSDPTERASLYKKAQQTVLDGFYILPLYDQQNHYLLSSKVQGFRPMPTVSTPSLYDAWLSK